MKRLWFYLPLIMILTGCLATLTPLQRRTFESKDLEGKFDDAYRSTLQVFQDYGYTVKNSDYQSGVVRGETGIRRNFLGVMYNFELTATMEQFGPNRVRERLSLIKKVKVNTKHGQNESSRIVQNPELFQELYNNIQKEMFIRRNLNR